MKVLVIVGSDLSVNSSANLCHRAYIQGLLDNGFSVDLLTVGTKEEIVRSENGTEYRFPLKSIYEMISTILRKNKPVQNTIIADNKNGISSSNRSKSIIRIIKKEIHRLYGPYEVYISWKRKAMHFRKEDTYDFVISLSFPPVSHYLADQLIKKKRIKTNRWIQIWEDPWCRDLVFLSLNDKKAINRAEKEEKYLLNSADEIIYVSPITLENQKNLFRESGHKMRWYPVPTYYVNRSGFGRSENLVYGYYGNYDTQVRNLEPFYNAALKEKITLNICGHSDRPFASTGKIQVRPRIALEELKPLEDATDVLVFVCNLRGGQIPGKIYQYSATKKTILFILDGTSEEQKILFDYFSKYNRFVFCHNTDEEIRNAIRRIENGDIEEVTNRILDDFTPMNIMSQIITKNMEAE